MEKADGGAVTPNESPPGRRGTAGPLATAALRGQGESGNEPGDSLGVKNKKLNVKKLG